MANPLINYDGEEREMTDEEWQLHQQYQAQTRKDNPSMIAMEAEPDA